MRVAITLALFVMMLQWGTVQAGEREYRLLFWEDLVPGVNSKGLTNETIDPRRYLDQLHAERSQDSMYRDTNIVTALDGLKVRIPAYVIPLEGDGRTTTEFMLAPFFGACIHVPPPPPNQLILGTSKEGIGSDMYNSVWAYGTIKAGAMATSTAVVGYSMTVDRVELMTSKSLPKRR